MQASAKEKKRRQGMQLLRTRREEALREVRASHMKQAASN